MVILQSPPRRTSVARAPRAQMTTGTCDAMAPARMPGEEDAWLMAVMAAARILKGQMVWACDASHITTSQ